MRSHLGWGSGERFGRTPNCPSPLKKGGYYHLLFYSSVGGQQCLKLRKTRTYVGIYTSSVRYLPVMLITDVIICRVPSFKQPDSLRRRESRWQAGEAQWEKGWQRSRARDKKQRRHFFVGRTTWKFCSGSDKMGNASGHHMQSENEQQWKKKWTRTGTTFPP